MFIPLWVIPVVVFVVGMLLAAKSDDGTPFNFLPLLISLLTIIATLVAVIVWLVIR